MQRREFMAGLALAPSALPGDAATAAAAGWLALAPAAGPAARPAASPPPLDTTRRTYVLFLDLLEVEAMDNAELVLHAAEKHPGNPVLPLGDVHEWDAVQATLWSGSLLYDREEQRFKLWYKGVDASRTLGQVWTGYAVSRDGIQWEKPRLGIFAYGGSTQNNICLRTNDARVVKDPEEPDPAKRYKMLSKKHGAIGNQGAPTYYPYYSADGIHWNDGPDVIVYPGPGVEINQLLIDPLERDPARRFKIYGQGRFPSNKRPGPEVVRKIITGSAPDIEHGHLSPANPILDTDDGLEAEMHFASMLIYRSYYLLLYAYDHYRDYHGHGRWGNFVGDVRLAVSRDGEHFRRVNPHRPLIPRGRRGEWDSGFLVPGAAVEHRGRIHLYYSGANENWSSWPSPNRTVGAGRSMAGFTYPAQTGLALLEPDGFTSLAARDGFGPGVVTTAPIRVERPDRARLRLNVSRCLPFRDWVEVEALDARTGAPIAGYTRAECTDVAEAGTEAPVAWGSLETLRAVAAPSIKLRFYLHGAARLHAFTFAES